MDLVKSRYETYDELYGYCYKVAGTVALMTTPVMGIEPSYEVRLGTLPGGRRTKGARVYDSTRPILVLTCRKCTQGHLEQVYRAALALGTANQLTNILRDVGEDVAQRNRIYVPLEDLERFNISEKEVLYLVTGFGTDTHEQRSC